MPYQILEFAPKVPAGTPQATPHTVAMTVGQALIERIRWRVPPGPSGLLHWHLAMGGVQVLPTGSGDIVANDESDTWELDEFPSQGDWELVGWNTGIYDHTVYLTFEVSPVAGPAGTGPASMPTLLELCQ